MFDKYFFVVDMDGCTGFAFPAFIGSSRKELEILTDAV
jgi:hypothetical protein